MHKNNGWILIEVLCGLFLITLLLLSIYQFIYFASQKNFKTHNQIKEILAYDIQK